MNGLGTHTQTRVLIDSSSDQSHAPVRRPAPIRSRVRRWVDSRCRRRLSGNRSHQDHRSPRSARYPFGFTFVPSTGLKCCTSGRRRCSCSSRDRWQADFRRHLQPPPGADARAQAERSSAGAGASPRSTEGGASAPKATNTTEPGRTRRRSE